MRIQNRTEISISIVGRPPPDVHRTKVFECNNASEFETIF
jgi:hypothetical protein